MNPFSLTEHLAKSQRLDNLHNNYQVPLNLLKTDYIENNTFDVDLDTPIYRIFNEERFFQMLTNKELVLVHTSSWDDPFENFLLNARWELGNGQQVDVSSVRDRYYGQC